MPLAQHILRAILIAAVTVVTIIVNTNFLFDDDIEIIDGRRSQSIGGMPAKDKYTEIYGTAFFKHWTGLSERLYDMIERRLHDRLYEARNIHFEFDPVTNAARKRRACKISNRNRILNFLHQMRTGEIIWNAAFEHGWNIYRASVDFFHVLYHFVDEFYDEWVCPMSTAEKNDMKGNWPLYPTAYQAMDGVQFETTKSTVLPDGYRRRDVYCWKHRWPQGKNVQAVVSQFGHATEVMVGPGAASDSAMSTYMCIGDDPASTLVDGTYPAARPEFIVSDGSSDHADSRSVVERYFSKQKLLWRMVGRRYVKGKRWFDMVLRASFILTNMVIFDEGSLNQS